MTQKGGELEMKDWKMVVLIAPHLCSITTTSSEEPFPPLFPPCKHTPHPTPPTCAIIVAALAENDKVLTCPRDLQHQRQIAQ